MNNWLVTYYKRNNLDKRQVLTDSKSLPEVIWKLLQSYETYGEGDKIEIVPSEIKSFGQTDV